MPRGTVISACVETAIVRAWIGWRRAAQEEEAEGVDGVGDHQFAVAAEVVSVGRSCRARARRDESSSFDSGRQGPDVDRVDELRGARR